MTSQQPPESALVRHELQPFERDDAESNTGAADVEPLRVVETTRTKEEKLVRGGRVTVLAVLLVSAVTVASLAYILLSRNEQYSFEEQFQSAAQQVILMTNRNAVNVFISFSTLASVYPSRAKKSAEQLPFATMDGFETTAAGIRNVSKALHIHYAPYLETRADLEKWQVYTQNHTFWIQEGRLGQDYGDQKVSDRFFPFVFAMDETGKPVPTIGDGPFVPSWQTSPVPANVMGTNFDEASFPLVRAAIDDIVVTGMASLSAPADRIRDIYGFPVEGPISPFHQPVFNDVASAPDKKVTGFLVGFLAWKHFLDNTLPEGQEHVQVVIQSCGINSTFEINGPEATFVGAGDLHDARYTDMGLTEYFVGSLSETSSANKHCPHIVHVYPTKALENDFVTDTPLYYALVVVSIFVFAALIFLLYDYFVNNRQTRTEQKASQSNAIVQDLFPGDVAAQLFASQGPGGVPTNSSLEKSGFGKVDRNTIAELHPDATVLFADICGFTAWSSTRDPHQVFTLLESIFQSFDAVAKKYGVFKVETIGDCYVAACGVPDVNAKHAVVMSRFARIIMAKFRSVCHSLELVLGPDTGDLSLRVGMHSGPVTAGVLRGQRARFQLFGDTVNTASRLESTGKRERVHLSEQTAQQLIQQGKEEWVVLRDDVVEAKGKGKLVTFWLKLPTNNYGATGSVTGDEEKGTPDAKKEWNVEMPSSNPNETNTRSERLVHWNSELLLELLQRVVARRVALQTEVADTVSAGQLATKARSIGDGTMVVNEVVEIIDMPEFVCTSDTKDVVLSNMVVEQLRDFVARINSMYNDNPFHNFEHASHVTMSISKLLGRIVAPKIDLASCAGADQQAAYLHDHTCGITSDPLTQFAVVLSGLIHDLDHPGVSNGQLINEDPKMAQRYQEKSVAEQNSVDLAWSVLMAPEYDQLRMAIFSTEAELRRFRNLLVNSIIATDIFDKDQGAIRKNRWNKAFYETTPDDDMHEVKSRKATIVIEHLIQASDVAHTMQHWHVYQKWNQRLFDEMMLAYRAGRSDKSPVDGWYGGELWFFDNYVIPLTKKLKDCGVFGVSSDEYLNYALHNRDEWEQKGRDVVEQYVVEFEGKVWPQPAASTAAQSVDAPNSTRLLL